MVLGWESFFKLTKVECLTLGYGNFLMFQLEVQTKFHLQFSQPKPNLVKFLKTFLSQIFTAHQRGKESVSVLLS